MSLVAIGTARSCGATTLALGLAATWPTARRLLLVEADPAGGTLAAASGWPPEPGLVTLAAAARRSSDAEVVLEHTQQLPGGAAVLPAPGGAERAATALAMSADLIGRLGELDSDVLLDCGRLQALPSSAAETVTAASNTAGFLGADSALLATRPRLSDLHAVAFLLADRALEAARSSGRLRLVLIGDGPYGDAEVSEAFGLEVAARLPNDPEAAEALSHLPATARPLRRAPLVRALRTLAHALAGEKEGGGANTEVPRVLHSALAPFRLRQPAATNGKAEVAR